MPVKMVHRLVTTDETAEGSESRMTPILAIMDSIGRGMRNKKIHAAFTNPTIQEQGWFDSGHPLLHLPLRVLMR